jgi:hypothetical protein
MGSLTDVIQLDLVPLVEAARKEAARLTAAVEGLACEVEHLTAVTADGLGSQVSVRIIASNLRARDQAGRVARRRPEGSQLLRAPDSTPPRLAAKSGPPAQAPLSARSPGKSGPTVRLL